MITLIYSAVYNPPPKSSYRLKNVDFEELLGFVFSLSIVNVLIAGDFNLEGVNWEACVSEDDCELRFLELCDKFHLRQLVTFQTTSANLLDLVLVNKAETLLISW